MSEHVRMWVDGGRIDAEDVATFEVQSPSTGEVIATVPEGWRGDAGRAIAAARRAWPGWGGPAGSASGVGRVGGRFSEDPLSELKTIVVHVG
jgi:hypothetical protein